jgi:tetratricopeptide (TPR) repeat protein
LQVRLLEVESEQKRHHPVNDLHAQDLALKAWSLLRRREAGAIEEARQLAQRAVARDAQLAFAWGLLAQSYAVDVSGRTVNAGRAGASRSEWLRRGEQAAERAYALDPNHPNVLAARAWVLALQGRGEEALPVIQRHLEIDRNNASAWFSFCYTLATLGRQDEAIRACQESMRLSPRDPQLGGYCIVTAAAHLYLEHDDEALHWARRSAAVKPNFSVPHAWIASAAAMIGDLQTAHAALSEFRRFHPDYTITSFREEKLCANAACEKQRERFYEGLRRAGLPE